MQPTEYEINEVQIIVPGDASVGIQDELFTFTGHWYLDATEENIIETRKKFEDLIMFIFGERGTVTFDFEEKALLEAEAELEAAQLAEEKIISNQGIPRPFQLTFKFEAGYQHE